MDSIIRFKEFLIGFLKPGSSVFLIFLLLIEVAGAEFEQGQVKSDSVRSSLIKQIFVPVQPLPRGVNLGDVEDLLVYKHVFSSDLHGPALEKHNLLKSFYARVQLDVRKPIYLDMLNQFDSLDFSKDIPPERRLVLFREINGSLANLSFCQKYENVVISRAGTIVTSYARVLDLALAQAPTESLAVLALPKNSELTDSVYRNAGLLFECSSIRENYPAQ